MPEITFLPDQKKIKVMAGTTVLGASRKARVTIRTRCGGKAGCLMCKVTVKDNIGLSAIKDNEKRKLGEEVNKGIRLACQAKIMDDTTVEIPEDPLKAAIRAQLEKQNQDDDWM